MAHPPRSLEELEILPRVAEAIDTLKEAGYLVIVVTNQPDVATGKQERSVVESMHEKLCAELAIDEVRVCYHVDADNCDCRKPKPGMLQSAAADWGIALEQSFMVGDRWRDIDAGKAAGCKTVFIDCDYTERRPEEPHAVVSSLADASKIIFAESRRLRTARLPQRWGCSR